MDRKEILKKIMAEKNPTIAVGIQPTTATNTPLEFPLHPYNK